MVSRTRSERQERMPRKRQKSQDTDGELRETLQAVRAAGVAGLLPAKIPYGKTKTRQIVSALEQNQFIRRVGVQGQLVALAPRENEEGRLANALEEYRTARELTRRRMALTEAAARVERAVR